MAVKIVVDVRFLQAGGYGTYLKEIIPRLLKEGIPPTLLGNPADIFEIFGKEMPIISCKARPFSLQEQVELPLKVPCCDLFWSPNYNISWLGVRAKKMLITLHDAFPFHPFFPLVKRVYARGLLKHAASKSTRILTVSHFSHADLTSKAGISPSKMTPIYLGVNRELFYPQVDNSAWEEVKQLYNLPSRFILFVGSSKAHKNFSGALQAAKLANLPLVAVGISPFNQSQKGVLFLEKIPVSFLRTLYQRAILLFYPSFYEGFGLPPLEAMACGCPVVTSSRASLPEVCGKAAYFVNPLNIEEMTEALSRVSTDVHLREELRQEGLKRVDLFKWDSAAKAHAAVIHALIYRE